MTESNSISAPGMAFQTLLSQSKVSSLRSLIGDEIIDVLEALNEGEVDRARLGELAIHLIDPVEALRDVSAREQILKALPLPKARELAGRLSVADSRSLYDDLCKASEEKDALEVLFSFFGVVRDIRAPEEVLPSLTVGKARYALFDHQRRAARKVKGLLGEHPRKTILHMPTGAGKTRTAMHIVSSHLKNNEPTLVIWLAQNAELLDQASDEFVSAWSSLGNRDVDVARFWGSRNPDLDDIRDGVVVAGLAKMASLDSRDPQTLLKLADRASLIVIDEAHQAIAPTYQSVLTALYSKRPDNALLGLTATPGRTWSDIEEDTKLASYFDGIKVTLEVEGYSDPVSFLIDQEYLAKPNFRLLNSGAGLKLSDDDVDALSGSIDVPEKVLEKLGSDTKRNLKIIAALEDLSSRHKRVIAFAPSVGNARMLSAILSYRGIESHVVTGESNTSERERIIRRFRSDVNRSLVLVNYGVLTTGFDAPSTSAALIARPTRSLVLYSQMVGRATRGVKARGNKEAEIVTVVDPHLPGFGSIAEAFTNWEDVWHEPE